jgi:hypothetical protein
MKTALFISRIVLFTVLLFLACSDDDPAARLDASPPDAASLTIGEICVMLTPVTCARDSECFQSFDPPCADSFYRRCCERFDSCEHTNGVSADQVAACIAGMESATCDEIENEFPQPCVDIARCTDCATITKDDSLFASWWDRSP